MQGKLIAELIWGLDGNSSHEALDCYEGTPSLQLLEGRKKAAGVKGSATLFCEKAWVLPELSFVCKPLGLPLSTFLFQFRPLGLPLNFFNSGPCSHAAPRVLKSVQLCYRHAIILTSVLTCIFSQVLCLPNQVNIDLLSLGNARLC